MGTVAGLACLVMWCWCGLQQSKRIGAVRAPAGAIGEVTGALLQVRSPTTKESVLVKVAGQGSVACWARH